MGVLSYIIPHEWVLQLVILLMIVLAAFVVYKCVQLYTIGKQNLEMLNKMENVSILEHAMLQNGVNLDHEFAKYEASLGKNDITFPLFEHLKAIYDSGARSSRLDADLLVKNTVNKIFTSVDSIKTSISLFLVIGILGTLAGLAISIGGFHGANFVMTGQGGTADELSLLFGNLRGAFAPSMWGVFFTIIFVFGYSWRIQEGCINKVTEKLTINTIRYWLPKLYPTDFQRGDQSLVKLNATIANADGINQGVRDLESNLNSSNETLIQLAKVSDSIQIAVDKFDKSTDKVTKIKELYEELKKNNETFSASLNRLIQSAIENRKASYQDYMGIIEKNYANLENENQKIKDNMIKYFDALSGVLEKQSNVFASGMQAHIDGWTATMENQNERLSEVLSQLKSYDAGFFESVNESQTALSKSIDVNLKSAEANQVLAEKLRTFEEKLLHRQDELMAQISKPVEEQLSKIATALKYMERPMGETAEVILKMADRHKANMDKTITPLTDITKSLESQQESLRDRNNEIKELLQSLTEMIKSTQVENRAMLAAIGKQHGASEIDITRYMKAHTEAMESGTTRKQRRNEKTKIHEKSSLKERLFNLNNIPVLVISILLLISVITQVVMVYRLTALEKHQNAVNQVLMKGDMNNLKSETGINPEALSNVNSMGNANALPNNGTENNTSVTNSASVPSVNPQPNANQVQQ